MNSSQLKQMAQPICQSINFYRALKNHHEIEVIQKTVKSPELDLGCIYHFDLIYRVSYFCYTKD